MSHEEPKGPQVYGVVAEFDDPDAILSAAKRTREEGYEKFEAYTPFPVHGLADAVDKEDHRLKWMIFFGGLAGACTGFGFQTWVSMVAYPHNVGGKPLFSWPAFIPVTFECMVLFAAGTAVFGMLGLNGLPRPHHPIFEAKNFKRCSQDRFFLCVEAEDPKFNAAEVSKFLKGLGALEVSEVVC